MRFNPKRTRYVLFIGVVICLCIAFCMRQVQVHAARVDATRQEKTGSERMQKLANSALKATAGTNPQSFTAGLLFTPQLRPLAVVRQSLYFEWTGEDAMDTNVIRQIAHNELEYNRLADENTRILRRQLVYRKHTIDALVEHAKATGTQLQQLMMPGFDGQEFIAELTMIELHPSGIEGAFAGQLSGRPDSMVTVAFKGGREAFTIISPSDNLYLQGDPREPGEIILKSVDPATYVPGVCGVP